ncbi:MAG: phosphoribosylamine--glycine ligase, partial [Epulopiscium sp.]|nr:phosphoribosylamine--glycine ligase [Candidatus Epulonipiscium sp.]
FCMESIYQPTLDAMAKEGRPFTGILFFGLMLTAQGVKVLEYNARFGDPETQVVLPRLKGDLVEIFEACIDGKLEDVRIEWKEEAAVCVVMASGGYPESPKTGYPIQGIEEIAHQKNVLVFQAGTKEKDGQVITNGGRVLGVTGLGSTLAEARQIAYQNVEKIKFMDQHYRKDIGIHIE